jgi:hypothetical protein
MTMSLVVLLFIIVCLIVLGDVTIGKPLGYVAIVLATLALIIQLTWHFH